MKKFRPIVIAALIVLLNGCTTYVSRDFPTYDGIRHSGTITVREDQILRASSGASGRGAIIFQGWEYGFVFEGAKLSVVGNESTVLEAAVYNLETIEDFAGNYEPTRAEIQAGEGLTGAWGKNEKGVVIYLRFNQETVEINKEAAGLKVTLE